MLRRLLLLTYVTLYAKSVARRRAARFMPMPTSFVIRVQYARRLMIYAAADFFADIFAACFSDAADVDTSLMPRRRLMFRHADALLL